MRVGLTVFLVCLASQVQAAEVCVNPTGSLPDAQAKFLVAATNHIIVEKGGTFAGIKADEPTGEICVTDPTIDLSRWLSRRNVLNVIQEIIDDEIRTDAAKEQNKLDIPPLRDEVRQAETDWDSLTRIQRDAAIRKMMRLRLMERHNSEYSTWQSPTLQ